MLSYVCNVENSGQRVQPLPVPQYEFEFVGNGNGFRRRDGRDVSSDGRNDDGSTPGWNPGVPRVGKVDTSGVGDSSDGGDKPQPVAPLVAPRMFTMPRRSSGQDVNHDLPRRSPADLLNDATDLDSDGSQPSGLPVRPWTPEMFRKRGRK